MDNKSKSQNQPQGSDNQSRTSKSGQGYQNLTGERFSQARPEEKAQNTFENIQNQGFDWKSGKEQTFIQELTDHVKQNPNLGRFDLLKHAYSRIDTNMIEEREYETEDTNQSSGSSSKR